MGPVRVPERPKRRDLNTFARARCLCHTSVALLNLCITNVQPIAIPGGTVDWPRPAGSGCGSAIIP